MKAIVLAILVAIAPISALAQSFNADAYLAANADVKATGLTAYEHIAYLKKNNYQAELQWRLANAADLTATANTLSDVKVMFCDCATLDENSSIQPTPLWYIGSALGKTTIKTMVQQGWKVQNVSLLNKAQFWVTFVK